MCKNNKIIIYVLRNTLKNVIIYRWSYFSHSRLIYWFINLLINFYFVYLKAWHVGEKNQYLKVYISLNYSNVTNITLTLISIWHVKNKWRLIIISLLFISVWFQSESKLYNGSEKDNSTSSKLTKKESLKVSFYSYFYKVTYIVLFMCLSK